jgi:hypothetical protein
MTRHGMVEPTAADVPPPATDPRAQMVNVAADRLATSNVRGRLGLAGAQPSGPSVSILTHPGGGCAIADIGRSSKSP